MILPDGEIREGIFQNNVFYGNNSPTSNSSPRKGPSFFTPTAQ